jgi:hypothetical protein
VNNILDLPHNSLDNRGREGILLNDKIDFHLEYPEEIEGEMETAPQTIMFAPEANVTGLMHVVDVDGIKKTYQFA